MKTSEIETIIFDFGGVIIDIDPQLTMNEFGKLGAEEQKGEQLDYLIHSIIRKFERGIFTPEVFRNKMREFLKIDQASDQDFDDAWNALLFDIPGKRIKAIETLKDNYQILLLSNSNEIHYDLYVRDLQLRFGYREFDDLFHKAYFSFDLHMTKPDPEIFEFVINQHDLDPAKALFIDDSAENTSAAQGVGLQAYHIEKPVKVRHLFEEGKLIDDLSKVRESQPFLTDQ
jgi:putative hydrolase of the HAD superfamily